MPDVPDVRAANVLAYTLLKLTALEVPTSIRKIRPITESFHTTNAR